MSIKNKRKVQEMFCRNHNYPHFAPRDGRCYYCGSQIYEKIDFWTAAYILITECPYCNRSFCE